MTQLHLQGEHEERRRSVLERFGEAWPTWAPLALAALLYGNTMWTQQAHNDEEIRQMKTEMNGLRKEVNDLRGDVRELTTTIRYLNARPERVR